MFEMPQVMGTPMPQAQVIAVPPPQAAPTVVPTAMPMAVPVAVPMAVPSAVPMAYPLIGAAQQQVFGGAPPQQMMAPVALQPVDPLQMLSALREVKIEQKMNLLETATGLLGDLLGVNMELEMSNKYAIQTLQGHNLFFAVETTDFVQRNCCGDCRGIDLDVVVLGQDPRVTQMAESQFDWSFNPFGSVDLSSSQKFLQLHKDCQLTCCCLNRPIIDVNSVATGQTLGKIRDPWACCDMTFELMDANGHSTLLAKGGCCQLGLVCPCPCGPCREVNFTVNDAQTGSEVAHMKKIIPDFLKFIAADDVSNYVIEFGNVQNPEWKAMLIALGIFLDFRYFNERSDKNEVATDSVMHADGGFGGDFFHEGESDE